MKSALSYATNLKVWRDLGYFDVPIISFGKEQTVVTLRRYKQMFFYRELYCLFVGAAIAICTDHVVDENLKKAMVKKRFDTAMTLLPESLDIFFDKTGLSPQYEQIDYYKIRIKEYASCGDNEIHNCFCKMYGKEIDNFDHAFVTKVALAISWFHTWYIEGSFALKQGKIELCILKSLGISRDFFLINYCLVEANLVLFQ